MKKQTQWHSLYVIFMIIICSIFFFNSEETAYATSETLLRQQLSALTQHPELVGVSVGISVRNATDGHVIYMYRGDDRLSPASSMKLVTSAAALQILGQSYRFSTEIYTDGKQKGNVLKGNLYIRGKGDPTLHEKDFTKIAISLKKMGIRKIKGEIRADDTWYDHTRLSLDLPWSDEQEYYGAQISGLTVSPNADYDAGTVIVQVKPGKAIGKPAKITLIPQTDFVEIINKTKVGKPDSKNTIQIVREHGSNRITLNGTMPLHSKAEKTWVSLWEPTGYALDLFKKSLEKQGIKITGRHTYWKVPSKHKKLLTDYSPTLATILVPYMKFSNNTVSETLVKEIGRIKRGKGSWHKGLAVIQEEFAELGIEEDSILMRDGSGLSHVNFITANALTRLLYEAQFKPWYSTYRNSLPVAGISDRAIGGTLKNRMRGTVAQGNVLAKTGTLSTVSSLTGYVCGGKGNKYVFSILINHTREDQRVKHIEDQLAIILASH